MRRVGGPNGLTEDPLKRFVRLAAGCCLALAALGGVLYMEGLHAAHPVTTLIKAPPTVGAPRRLFVFVKGGSADLRRGLLTDVRIAWIRYFSELTDLAAHDSSVVKPPTVGVSFAPTAHQTILSSPFFATRCVASA